MKIDRGPADITLTGIGIGGFQRTTLETVNAFKTARIILHLTSYQRQLKRYCKHVVNLENQYWTGEQDEIVYRRLANKILSEARNGPRVVVVDDGHPAFYDDVAWDVCRRGRRGGLRVDILPAVSCLDAMISECGLEITSRGLQVFEASALVGECRQVDPRVDTLIMQAGWFGNSLLQRFSRSGKGRFRPLIRHLRRFYPNGHLVRILQAPGRRREEPLVRETQLRLLGQRWSDVPPAACLFLPAVNDKAGSDNYLDIGFVASTFDRNHVKRIVR